MCNIISKLNLLSLSLLHFPGDELKSAEESQQKADIGGRIIAASPILEAFGNAMTIRNPNSSRFGKWMELNFNSENQVCGSNITSYLLEKSRVTRHDPKERNYHIFYQICRGAQPEQLEQWKMSPVVSAYRYLGRQGCADEPPDLGDARGFREAYEAFLAMGFDAAETNSIFSFVGAVLNLGNVEFVELDQGEASAVSAGNGATEKFSSVLGVQENLIKEALCHRTMTSGPLRKSVIRIELKASVAADTRDSLAMSIFDKLFQYIIDRINENNSASIGLNSAGERHIGLLDIFGFEIFDVNSLGQMCINYCNEMLQNHFNYVIFTAEKDMYIQEGVTCETIEFKDNQPVIQEIQNLFRVRILHIFRLSEC